MKLIERYNQYYNDECAASPWGGITSMEHLQATTIRAALYAFAPGNTCRRGTPLAAGNLMRQSGGAAVVAVPAAVPAVWTAYRRRGRIAVK